MNTMEARVLKLEGQMNAMAQAWLYLAAAVEMQCGAELSEMERALCAKRWPGGQLIDAEARQTLQWLCKELSAARAVRAERTAREWNGWQRRL